MVAVISRNRLPGLLSESLVGWKPVWPPRKADLERLYVRERLSAAKIAAVYGLRYASPKVAESAVLYHPKRNGIQRRGCAEHVRKVDQRMEDEWVRRYEAGESLKQIAGDVVDLVSVWNHLRRRGVRLRDKVEAQIQRVSKHSKKPFSGDPLEKAYILGLRFGDLAAVRARARNGRTASLKPVCHTIRRTHRF
jgi:hypothetical protein